MTLTELPQTPLPADLMTACGIVEECGDCDEWCAECLHDKMTPEDDHGWLVDFCHKCGKEVGYEAI